MTSDTDTALDARADAKHRRSKRDNDNYDLVTSSLEAIRREIALGTAVDPALVKDIETRLANFYSE